MVAPRQATSNQPIVGRFLHPRAPGNPEDFQMHWEDLADLNPEAKHQARRKTPKH
jgi:hypothetical protein